MNKTTVIYHSADFDGLFCREIARKFLLDAKLIGWDFGNPLIPFPAEGKLYILDLSPDCLAETSTDNIEQIVWIDHHKSSIEKWDKGIPGYRIDGVAACRLVWQWFSQNFHRFITPDGKPVSHPIATKGDFVNRTVLEPLAVRLAGEYDIWDHRDNDADVAFQFGLDSQEGIGWHSLLDPTNTTHALAYVEDGRKAMQCYRNRDAEVMRSRSFTTSFHGMKFLCLNTARCNSNTFAALDVPETGHDGLLAFYWNGKEFSVSMYHAAHRKDLDLSLIAVKHGGGGHRGACGFRTNKLPFLP